MNEKMDKEGGASIITRNANASNISSMAHSTEIQIKMVHLLKYNQQKWMSDCSIYFKRLLSWTNAESHNENIKCTDVWQLHYLQGTFFVFKKKIKK